MLRFAPSPTGDMHIGNLKVALLNYIVARQKGEKFLVRIEDTDKKRNIEGKDREILDILNLFEVEIDEVLYQSNNLKFHQQFATKLLMDKKAFNCFCTSKELEIKKERAKKENRAYRYDGTCKNLPDSEVIDNEKPFTVRIKRPNKPISFKDLIKGDMSFDPEEIDDFVILRVDKTPTYNFACAVDDMLSDISVVIRGEDHLSNTPKQIHIRKSLGYEKQIEYAHLPIILNEDGKKMSKRDNASSVKWLLDEGFLPQAIANYLILIGYKAPKEFFTINEAIEWFDIKKVSKSPAKFNLSQLKSLNREHIKAMDSLKLASLIGFKSKEIGELAKLYTEESSKINEIKDKISKIFLKKVSDEYHDELKKLKAIIKDAPHFEEFNQFKAYLQNKSGLKGKNLFKPLRILLTAEQNGPNLSDIYQYIKNYIKEIAR